MGRMERWPVMILRLVLTPVKTSRSERSSRISAGSSYDVRVTSTQTQPRTGASTRGKGSYDERRDALAESALQTLGELGYARTSLREIAANSDFSHGVLHYYFRDKTELITYCVRYYKARCVTRYDGVVADSVTGPELVEAFADKLVETIVDEAAMHRLWYDLRTQSMFDSALRDDVLYIDGTIEAMIWRVLERYAALEGRTVALPRATAYAMLDGVFEQTLLRYVCGDVEALDRLRQTVIGTLPSLLA